MLTMVSRMLGPALAVSLLLAGCSSEPFQYVKVSGKVTYEDGSAIPAPRLSVEFVPQAKAVDAKTVPRPGKADVDPKTGEFKVVTSHTYDDGLVPGEHKVVVRAVDLMNQPLPGFVPPEYGDLNKTPLKVNTSDPQSFVLKVQKPSGR